MSEYKLTGLITAYQPNNDTYNFIVEKNYFRPKNDSHSYSIFVGSFTSASQEHFHYENGVNPSFFYLVQNNLEQNLLYLFP
ncbi:DUF7710 domain-containing protein [Aeromonas hydrophila]